MGKVASIEARTDRIEVRMDRRNSKAYIMAGLAFESFRSENQVEAWFDKHYTDRDAMLQVEGQICFRDPHAPTRFRRRG